MKNIMFQYKDLIMENYTASPKTVSSHKKSFLVPSVVPTVPIARFILKYSSSFVNNFQDFR